MNLYTKSMKTHKKNSLYACRLLTLLNHLFVTQSLQRLLQCVQHLS